MMYQQLHLGTKIAIVTNQPFLFLLQFFHLIFILILILLLTINKTCNIYLIFLHDVSNKLISIREINSFMNQSLSI